MPRPTNKTELTALGHKNYEKLNQLIGSFSKEEQHADFPEGTMNRNIRDVLTHLHQWHEMVLDWYEAGNRGEKPIIPGEGYTWKTLPALNKKIWEKYQDTSLEEASKMLDDSFEKVQKAIAERTDEELFEKKHYKWTGTTSLAAYFISATSSHYDWAFKLIKRCKK